MSYTQLDDNLLVQMYEDPDITVKAIRKHFRISAGTMHRHLKANGIDSDRKTSTFWTDQEEVDLITAREAGLTGSEIYERIPTRTPVAVKLHLQKLRDLKKTR